MIKKPADHHLIRLQGIRLLISRWLNQLSEQLTDSRSASSHPKAGIARPNCEKLKKNGLLCKATHNHIIRFAPPLVITKDQI